MAHWYGKIFVRPSAGICNVLHHLNLNFSLPNVCLNMATTNLNLRSAFALVSFATVSAKP